MNKNILHCHQTVSSDLHHPSIIIILKGCDCERMVKKNRKFFQVWYFRIEKISYEWNIHKCCTPSAYELFMFSSNHRHFGNSATPVGLKMSRSFDNSLANRNWHVTDNQNDKTYRLLVEISFDCGLSAFVLFNLRWTTN